MTRSGWPNPKVIISDRPPESIPIQNAAETAAVRELLGIMRRDGEPILLVWRHRETGAVEVAARSGALGSVQQAVDLMRDATAKLVDRLFDLRLPVRPD